MKHELAPVRNQPFGKSPWEGSIEKKPWSYKITAVIPTLDPDIEGLKLVVDLLRLQTERPYIVIIDTGSLSEFDLDAFRAPDLEVHRIACNALQHPSELCSMALDVAHAVCRTQYLFQTHSDCFLCKQDALQTMLERISNTSPVVGYQISPRPYVGWEKEVGHTCLLYDCDMLDSLGITWKMRRLLSLYPEAGTYAPTQARPNFPDTEQTFNTLLKAHGIEPVMIGTEQNRVRNTDDLIDHCRSLTCGQIYDQPYHEKVKEWYAAAKREAAERVKLWKYTTSMNKFWKN